MTDLWPDDFGKIDVVPPVAILREQAEVLKEKTKGLIQGLVQLSNAPSGSFDDPGQPWTTATSTIPTGKESGSFFHTFYLVAPSLDSYSYRLFGVRHPLESYPLEIYFDEKKRVCHNEDEFIQQLKEVLSSEKTKKVVKAILSQAKSLTA
jgi:hypothetical protein